MPFYRVNEAGIVGFIDKTDRRPYELPPQGWSSVENARMLNKSAIFVSPWTEQVDLGEGTCHALDFYNPPTTAPTHLYAYMDDKILSIDNGNTVRTVSKAGLTSSPYPDQIWITDKLNGIPIATNNRDSPQCFYNGGGTVDATTVSEDFPDWGAGGTYANATAKFVVAYKNFIIALNIVDSSPYPNMVAWSDAAAAGSMPQSWDYNDPTNLAGRTVLGAEAGAIVGAATLRDSLFIYTEYSTYRMDFIGGQFIMRFTRVFQNSGMFGPRCVAKYRESHFVITKSDIIVHDGQQSVSVGDEKIRNRFFQGISEEDVNRVWVSPYLRLSEVLVGVPTPTQDKVITTCLVWQSDESVWSLRDLPDTRYMKELPVSEPSITDDSWDNGQDVTWDGGPDNIWNEGGAIGDLQPIITSTDNKLYILDSGDQTADTVLQKEDINLSGDESTEMATTVYPRMRGQNTVQIRLGASSAVESSIEWGPYIDFNPQSDYLIKTRAKGRRHAIEFRGRGLELEGYDIEFKYSGRR